MPLPDHVALLEELAAALSSDPVPPEPPRHHLDLMAAAVAFHFTPAAIGDDCQPHRARRAARRTARVGLMAASLVMAVASAAAASGVAAEGLPLPRPLRAVADAVGLPVDSVALDDTHRHLRELREAARSDDHSRVQWVVTKLHEDISRLAEDERREARPEVDMAVAEATRSLAIGSTPPAAVESQRTPGDRPASPDTRPVIEDPETFSANAAGPTAGGDDDVDRSSGGTPDEVTTAETVGMDAATASGPDASEPAGGEEDTEGTTAEDFSNLQPPMSSDHPGSPAPGARVAGALEPPN